LGREGGNPIPQSGRRRKKLAPFGREGGGTETVYARMEEAYRHLFQLSALRHHEVDAEGTMEVKID
jgi:hypothetical protein